MVYVIQVCYQLASGIRTELRPDPASKLANIEFYSKNKFEKLVHLVGFIIRICHYTRSPERRTENTFAKKFVSRIK